MEDVRSVSKEKLQWLLEFACLAPPCYKKLTSGALRQQEKGQIGSRQVDLVQKMVEDGAIHGAMSRRAPPAKRPQILLTNSATKVTCTDVYYNEAKPGSVLEIVRHAMVDGKCRVAHKEAKCCRYEDNPVTSIVGEFLDTGEWSKAPQSRVEEVLDELCPCPPSHGKSRGRHLLPPKTPVTFRGSRMTFEKLYCLAELCRFARRRQNQRQDGQNCVAKVVEDGGDGWNITSTATVTAAASTTTRAIQLAVLLHELWHTNFGALRFLLHLKGEKNEDNDEMQRTSTSFALLQTLLAEHDDEMQTLRERIPFCKELVGAFCPPAPFGLKEGMIPSDGILSVALAALPIGPVEMDSPDGRLLVLLGSDAFACADKVKGRRRRKKEAAGREEQGAHDDKANRGNDATMARGEQTKAIKRMPQQPPHHYSSPRVCDSERKCEEGRLFHLATLEKSMEAYCVAVEKAFVRLEDARLKDDSYFLKRNRPALTAPLELLRARNPMGIFEVPDLLF